MTAITNTFQTYQAKGIREDLSDLISNIAPTDTTFMNMVGKDKVENTRFEWQTDTLAAADTANAQIEGDDLSSFTAVTPTVRVSNLTQISRKDLIVAGTTDAVTKAGRKSELAFQIVKKTKELKRDQESILLTNQASAAGNASTARTTGGVRAWIKTNTSLGATGANGGYNTGTSVVDAATDGTQRAFTEALLKSVILQCYNSGGDPDTVMVGPFNKQVLSGFTGNNTRTQDTSDGKLATAIDVYESDFGTLKVVANRFQRGRDAFVLQSDMWKIGYLRPMKVEELAKTGDAEKRMLIVEYGLISKNEAASGVVADLTTS